MGITLYNPNWQDDKSTKQQRQLIDVELRRKLWLTYAELLDLCSQQAGRQIKDIGQLSKGEASKIIKLLLNRASV